MDLTPPTLTGKHVKMVPLSIDHHADLAAIGLDQSLWKWIPYQVLTMDDIMKYIRTALAEQERGVSMPFAICLVENDLIGNGRAIGSTRYMNIDAPNLRVEIGSTWIAPSHQRTIVNTEAKYLMLRHAFETMKCNRVELKTDVLNEKSRNAILRIGAKQEGIFRKHVVCHDGRVRDSVYFSIIREEWQEVKAKLEAKLESKL